MADPYRADAPPAPGSRRARRLAEAAAAQAAGAAAAQAAGAARAATADPAASTAGATAPAPGAAGHDRTHQGGIQDDRPRRVPGPVSRGPLLPVASVLLAGWSLTCLIDLDRPRPLVGMLAAVAALSPLAATSAVLTAAFALRGRRWVTTGVTVVAAVVPWLFALPYAVPASSPSGPTTPVRVLVVNAHEGRSDPQDIVAAVRSQSVDLLVVTELTSRMAHDLTTNGIDGRLVARWVSVPPISSTGTAAQAGLGIWSRFAMSDFTPVTGTRWPAVRAKLETGHGKLTVVAGHVVPPTLLSSGSWSTDLAALHRAGEVPGPVTVLGGLNGTPWNPQFRAAASDGMHDAGDVLGRGVRPTWPSWLGVPLLPLDHALVGGRVGVQSLVGVTIDGTDHRALLVGLLVPDDRT
jgi:endonuclease/exonuclease/phosphatase (EEP) superfamily protein YafD